MHYDEKIQANVGYLLGYDQFECSSLQEYKEKIEHQLPTVCLDSAGNITDILQPQPYIEDINAKNEILNRLIEERLEREKLDSLAKEYLPIFKNSGLGIMLSGDISCPEISIIQTNTGITKYFDKDSIHDFMNTIYDAMNKCFIDFDA